MGAAECAGFVLLLLWILPLLNFPLEVTLGFQSLQGSSNNSHTPEGIQELRSKGLYIRGNRQSSKFAAKFTHPKAYTSELDENNAENNANNHDRDQS